MVIKKISIYKDKMTQKTIDVPRSEQFDDVYFSAVDGLAETRHVFLHGNNLPAAWQGRDVFTIAETGFGTGLNFLAILKLWNDTDVHMRPKNLRFISFEKYPLSHDYIKHHLSPWSDVGDELSLFLSKYPVDINKEKYELDICGGVDLVLYLGDVNDAIAKVDDRVDCWFLDGFKPSGNPDMWSETVFDNIARLSQLGASFATFTSAGFVRRGLSAVGFDVKKIRGFGRKREMSVGTFVGSVNNEG